MATWGEIARQLGYANSGELLAAAQKSNAEYETVKQVEEPFMSWDYIRSHVKCGPTVWARIRRLNPDHRGIKAGVKLRGYHPKRNTMENLMFFWMGPKQFIKMFGQQAYREIPKRHLRNKGHKKLISMQYIQMVGLKRIDLNEQEDNRRGHSTKTGRVLV